MNNESLTESQAYAAMFFFLEDIYKRQADDVIGGLLGSMSWLQDEKPMDDAIVGDWRQAVQKALSGEKPFFKFRPDSGSPAT